MNAKHMSIRVSIVTAIAIAMLSGAPGAQASTPPIKQVITSRFGAEVNLTQVEKHGGPAYEDVCSVESNDTCQTGRESTAAGGFTYPKGVAVGPTGDVYVTDNDARVQELTPTGEFVLMFGREVNETTTGNICTAISGDTCKSGVPGAAAGQLERAAGITIDPRTGDVYVSEEANNRVQEFTSTGEFVLMIGKDVDATTDGNVCTAVSKDICQAGIRGAGRASEPAAFDFLELKGDLLAVGGPEDLLYVGDEHRVQEFDPASGEFKGEISLAQISTEPGSIVVALTVNNEPASSEYGDVYLVYKVHTAGSDGVEENIENVIRKFTSAGVEIQAAGFPLSLSPRTAGTRSGRRFPVEIQGIALDSDGRLAVSESETAERAPLLTVFESFGLLYEGATGRLVTEFEIPANSRGEAFVGGLAFGAGDELYAVDRESQEIVAYKPVPVAELVLSPTVCNTGTERESDVTFACVLNGEANPYGVPGTEVWFQWGSSGLFGSETSKHEVAMGGTFESVPATLEDLRPNATYYYQMRGFDENVQAPETPLSSEAGSFSTAYVPPRIVGESSISFVKSSSAVMHGELNPENARTEYFFEYAPGDALADCPKGVRKESCPVVSSTGVSQSASYGRIGETSEASDLPPGTTFHYRLAAVSENAAGTEAQVAVGAEGSFTTALAPAVAAVTGSASAITATSAQVSGAVNPDGQPATYSFELGVYEGAGTQYGVAFSAAVPGGTVPVGEVLALTGLQPGTTYAYRIAIKSGYGAASGEPVLFTTAGLPEVLLVPSPLVQLSIPAIAFPTTAATVKHGALPKKAAKKKKAKSGKHKRAKRVRRRR